MNRDRLRIVGVFGVLFVLPLLFINSGTTYALRILVQIAVFAVLALSLNIVFGHTNQLFFFIGALSGSAAYATALAFEFFEISPWLTLLPAAVLTGIIGMIVSYAAARRRFGVVVISIITLAMQLAFQDILTASRDITGGITGLQFTGFGLESLEEALGIGPFISVYYIVVAILAIVVLFYRWLMRSKHGVALEAIRQDEEVAEFIGINVLRYKTFVGFLSAFIIGLVGPFYAQFNGFVAPSTFSLTAIDIIVLIALIVGGLRTVLGPIIGAGIVVTTNQLLQSIGQLRSIVFGLLLLVLFLYFRSGVVPFFEEALVNRTGDLRNRVFE